MMNHQMNANVPSVEEHLQLLGEPTGQIKTTNVKQQPFKVKQLPQIDDKRHQSAGVLYFVCNLLRLREWHLAAYLGIMFLYFCF